MIRSQLVVAIPTLCALAIGPCPPSLSAQEPPANVDAEATASTLATMRASGVPALLRQWPKTALARLHAEPEVADAVAKVIAWHRADLERRGATLTAAIDLKLELEPWLVHNMFLVPDLWRAVSHPLAEVRRMDFAVETQNTPGRSSFAFVMSCLPQFEGRWTQAFEREAAMLSKAPWFTAKEGAKMGGFPGHLFLPITRDDDQNDWYDGSLALWMQHLPGMFVFGSGLPDESRPVAAASEDGRPEVALTMHLDRFVEMFQASGMAVPADFAALGFDGLKRLEWRASIAGEHLLDEFEVVLAQQPTGLVGALLTGKAALPPQALPEGALAQLRVAVDFELLIATAKTMAGNDLALSTVIEKDLPTTFDGGLAFGICAPAAGGLIPRMLLTLGIGDDAAFDRVLQQAIEDGMPVRQVDYDGVPCTLLKFPDLPQGIQPAFCKLDGKLHIAESGRSLREFLKEQKGGDVAMDVGDAPLPPGKGEILPSLDLRFDEVATYRAFRELWLPLTSLIPHFNEPPLDRDDMPDVDVVAAHCGKSRGILRKDGERYVVQHLGTFGGPELAALLMTWAPIFATNVDNYFSDNLARLIARQQLESVWTALESFHAREKRWPKDLAELFASGKLAADALLLPADDLAEAFTLANGGSARSSFRYFAEPVTIDSANGRTPILLVEIRSRRYERAMLATDGSIPDVYGDASTQTIDKFGK